MLPKKISERMRLQLLAEEFKLRKKQPEAWTKTKYRPYANFKTRRLVAEPVLGAEPVIKV